MVFRDLTCLVLISSLFSGYAFPSSAIVQNPQIDSLKLSLHEAEDSLKVDLFNQIAYAHYYHYHDSTGHFAALAINLASEIGYKRGLAEAQRMMGIYEKARNNNAKAINWLIKGLETAQDIAYFQGIADNLNSLGVFYKYSDERHQAIRYFSKSVDYQRLAGNRFREGILYSNIAETYMLSHKLDSAQVYFEQALHILDSVGNPNWQAMIYSQYGSYLIKKGDPTQARNFSEMALRLSKLHNQTFHEWKSYQNLAEIYFVSNQTDRALQYATVSLKMSNEIGFIPFILEALTINHKIARVQNQLKEALEFLEEYALLRDSLRHIQVQSEAGLLIYQTTIETKERENLILRRENEAEQAINAANIAIIQRQKLIVIGISIILGLVSLLAVSFFVLRGKERAANTKLVITNQKLQEQKDQLASTLLMVEQLNAQLQAQNNTLNQSAIVTITDLGGNILYINDNFCQVTGYTRDELQGKNIKILNSGEHTVEHFKELWSTINGGETWRGEIKNKKKDGTFYWCNTAIAPIFDEHANPKQFFGLQFEITKQKKYIRELADKSQELEELNKLKDRLLSIISHDFRSPLNSLQGTLNLLARGALSDDEFKMVTNDLVDKLDHTSNLLENLLNWAKSQMEGMKVYPHSIDIHTISNDCVELLTPIAEKKLVSILNRIPANTYAIADNEMIKLVIRNLVSNAIKFSKPSDCVELEAYQDNGQLVVRVIDTGVGISNENQEKLFKAESVTTSGTSNERGIGLGLLLCKEFVEKNKGQIWFESELQKGSTFYFTLPINNS